MLYHDENGAVLPSASTVKLYRQSTTPPLWELVATYDVLADGHLMELGTYGLSMVTNIEPVGTMLIKWTWTSDDTGLSYAETFEFGITADSSSVLVETNLIIKKLKQTPRPDNERIWNIAKALGVENNWNSLWWNSIQGTKKETLEIRDMVSKIHVNTQTTKKGVSNIKDDTKRSLQSFNDKEMQKNVNSITNELKSVTADLQSKLSEALTEEGNSGKLNTIEGLSLWGKQFATMFSKVDLALEELEELKNNQVDFTQAMPQMVAQELQQMVVLATQQMMQQQFGGGQQQNQQQG